MTMTTINNTPIWNFFRLGDFGCSITRSHYKAGIWNYQKCARRTESLRALAASKLGLKRLTATRPNSLSQWPRLLSYLLSSDEDEYPSPSQMKTVFLGSEKGGIQACLAKDKSTLKPKLRQLLV